MLNDGPFICAFGDVHGHLQLALCIAAQWQEQLNIKFDAVLLSGDVGTFNEESQLDSATRRHAKADPAGLEFMYQWSLDPQPEWLQRIFAPINEKGLGLQCPVVMVHGNHEGFAYLESLVKKGIPAHPVYIDELPSVDTNQHIHYLPSGWKLLTSSGLVMAGVGGIEKGQRHARYHNLAYLNDDAIFSLLEGGKVDMLLTHQGPSALQGEHGSQSLQLLLDEGIARVWFHGHSTRNIEINKGGPQGRTTIVPLGNITSKDEGHQTKDIGEYGCCWACLGNELIIKREKPSFWREFSRHKWLRLPNGQLISPSLARFENRRQPKTDKHH
jgi:hypothetical protein